MRKHLNKIILALFLQIVFAANVYLPVFSQATEGTPEEGVDLSLTPTFLTLATDPGEEVSSEFTVTNNSNFTEDLQVTVSKFEAAEGGSRPLISDMTEEDVHRDWVVFEEAEFSVPAGESKEVRFTISPPESASLGYYYAFIVSRVSQQESQDGGAVIAGAPAVLTLLDVRSPNAKRELQITGFKTDKAFYEYLPATFHITVKNSGNVHLSPVGDVFIDSMRNKDIAALRVNEGRSNVLPDTERTFEVIWNDGFAVNVPKVDATGATMNDDKGNPVYETRYDFSQANEFRIGKYTANLLLAYNDGEKDVPMVATVSFWVIPWKILGGAAIILLFAIIGLRNTIFPPLKRLFKRK